jgi:N-acetylglucosamine kinase-like BadF-type ATPase
MQLTSIQYNAIMIAINNAKEIAKSNDLLDPYAEEVDGYSNELLETALNEVEDMIINANIPF